MIHASLALAVATPTTVYHLEEILMQPAVIHSPTFVLESLPLLLSSELG